MLDNFLNKSKPINFVGLLILFFLCFLLCLLKVFFNGDFTPLKVIKSIAFSGFFLFIFFMFSFIISKNNLTFDNSYAFYFIVLISIIFLPFLFEIHTLFLISIYLLVLRKTYSLRSPKFIFEKIFDASFWLGVLFILEPLTIIFLVLIYTGIYVHKKMTLNAVLIPIIGFATPLIIYFTYLFWFDNIVVFYNLFSFEVGFEIKNYKLNKLFVPLFIILIITLISVFLKSRKTLSVNNTFKRSWILLIVNFTLSLVFVSLYPTKKYDNFLFMIFPMAIILANGLELIERKLFKNIILLVVLAGSLFSFFIL